MAQYTLHLGEQERDDIIAVLETAIYNPHRFAGRERWKILLDRVERIAPDVHNYGGKSDG